jgi:hypothetical protein
MTRDDDVLTWLRSGHQDRTSPSPKTFIIGTRLGPNRNGVHR